MCKHWAVRLSAKIHKKVRVEAQTAALIDINLQEVGAVLGHAWVKLLVPCAEEGVCDV